MKNIKQSVILLLTGLLLTISSSAQIAISNDGSAPDNSAMLDVKSTTKGMLVPRMTTAQRSGMISPAEGLMVFDLTTRSFWFYRNSAWADLGGSSGWSLTGNAGTNPATNFIGTTDNVSLEFRANNTRSGLIDLTHYNTSFGYQSLIRNFSGQFNTALGTYAMLFNDGFFNTAVGYSSLCYTDQGVGNTAIGTQSLLYNNNGSYNTAIGQNALMSNSDGSGNVAIGNMAGYYETGDNKLYIDNRQRADMTDGRQKALIYGVFDVNLANQKLTFNAKVGIGTTTPAYRLDVDGDINVSGSLMQAGTPFTSSQWITKEDNIYYDGGNVGIGVAVPQQRLEVLGNISADNGSTTSASYRFGDGSENTGLSSPDTYCISFINNGLESARFDALGRMSIGVKNPATSAQLELSSTTRGFLPPRMSTSQMNAITDPVTGLLVYNSDDNTIYNYNGSTWTKLTVATGKILADADGDTKVEVEKTVDVDTIRFSTAGNEYFSMSNGRLSVSNSGKSVFIGKESGVNDDLSNNQNIFIGNKTGNQNTQGYSNVALGACALKNNTVGFNQVAIGDSALFNQIIDPTGYYGNTAIGSKALFSNTTGAFNTASGFSALQKNQSGNYNTAYGMWALSRNTSGNYNTAIGSLALLGNTTGSFNTVVGSYIFLYHETSNNTLVGYKAGSDIGCDKCTFLGSNAHTNHDGTTNALALGYNAMVSGSDQAMVGNSQMLFIGGWVGWSTISDGRYKKNISENVPGIAFISKLRPVTYNLDVRAATDDMNRKDPVSVHSGEMPEEETQKEKEAIAAKSKINYSGFIAQEVEAAAKSTGYDFSGICAPQNETDLYSLRYAEFVVPLVKAVQEQQLIIINQQNQIDALLSRVEALEKKK